MSPLLRRRKTQEPAEVEPEVTRVGNPTAKKGKPTPRRKDREVGRIGPPEPPPRTRKEAYARSRATNKADRGKARAGISAGDDKFMLARDQGPIRELIRDVVDSRRGIGSWFLVIGLLIIVGNGQQNPTIRTIASIVWGLLIVALVTDWALMGRKVSRLVHERFPEDTTAMRRHIGYAIMRSIQFRKLRQPPVRVKYGQDI